MRRFKQTWTTLKRHRLICKIAGHLTKPAKSPKVSQHHSDERLATPVWLKPQPEPQRKQLLSPHCSHHASSAHQRISPRTLALANWVTNASIFVALSPLRPLTPAVASRPRKRKAKLTGPNDPMSYGTKLVALLFGHVGNVRPAVTLDTSARFCWIHPS